MVKRNNTKKLIFLSLVIFSVFTTFLIIANPLLLQNSLLLLDATSSGGKASATGVSASSGAAGGGRGSDGGGDSVSGSSETINENIVIILTSPSLDLKSNNVGKISIQWNNTSPVIVKEIELHTLLVEFEQTPITLTKNRFFVETVFDINYQVKQPVSFGVHQIPIKVTITHLSQDYSADSFITIDNTGLFFIMEIFRSFFGEPVVSFK